MKPVIVAAIVSLLVPAGAAALEEVCPSLPTAPVTALHFYPGAASFFDVQLIGIGGGYSIVDGTYPGWSVEDNHQMNTPDPITLHCSYATTLPANFGEVPWDQVTYLLNHKQGDLWDVQAALWLLVWGSTETLPATAAAEAMVADALANGTGFVPAPGQRLALIVYSQDGVGIGGTGYSDTIIETEVVSVFQACGPGFWKNHFDSWAATGVSTDDDFDTVFGTDLFSPDITLGEAVAARGGGAHRLARLGVAALLSAAHPDVGYPYSVAETTAFVQAGDADTLAEVEEILECPLP